METSNGDVSTWVAQASSRIQTIIHEANGENNVDLKLQDDELGRAALSELSIAPSSSYSISAKGLDSVLRALFELEHILTNRSSKQLKALLTLVCAELSEHQLQIVIQTLIRYERCVEGGSIIRLPICRSLITILLEMRKFDYVFRLTPIVVDNVKTFCIDALPEFSESDVTKPSSEDVQNSKSLSAAGYSLIDAMRFLDSIQCRLEMVQHLLVGYNEGPTLAVATISSLEKLCAPFLNWILTTCSSSARILSERSESESSSQSTDSNDQPYKDRSDARTVLRLSFSALKALFTILASTAMSSVTELSPNIRKRFLLLSNEVRHVAGSIIVARKEFATSKDEMESLDALLKSWPDSTELTKVRVREAWLMNLQPRVLYKEDFSAHRRTIASLCGSTNRYIEISREVDRLFEEMHPDAPADHDNQESRDGEANSAPNDLDEEFDDDVKAAISASLALEKAKNESKEKETQDFKSTIGTTDSSLWPEGPFGVSSNEVVNIEIMSVIKQEDIVGEKPMPLALSNVSTPHLLQGTSRNLSSTANSVSTYCNSKFKGRAVNGDLISGMAVELPPISSHVFVPSKRGDWIMGYVSEHIAGKLKVVPLSKGVDADYYWPDEVLVSFVLNASYGPEFLDLAIATGGVGIEEISCKVLPSMQQKMNVNMYEASLGMVKFIGHTSEIVVRKGIPLMIQSLGQNYNFGTLSSFNISLPKDRTQGDIVINCSVRIGNGRGMAETVTAPLSNVRLIDRKVLGGARYPREVMNLWTDVEAFTSESFLRSAFTGSGDIKPHAYALGCSTVPTGFQTTGIELEIGDEKSASRAQANHVFRGQAVWLGSDKPRALELTYSLPNEGLNSYENSPSRKSPQDMLHEHEKEANEIRSEETAALSGSMADLGTRTVSIVGVQRLVIPDNISLQPLNVRYHNQPILAPHFSLDSPKSDCINVLELNPFEGGITFVGPQAFTVELFFRIDGIDDASCLPERRVLCTYGGLELPASASLNSSTKASPGFILFLDHNQFVCVSPPPQPEPTLITKTKIGSNEQNEKTALACSFQTIRISTRTENGKWHRVLFSSNGCGEVVLQVDSGTPAQEKADIHFLPASPGGSPGAVSCGNAFYVGGRLSTLADTRRTCIQEPFNGNIVGVRLWSEHCLSHAMATKSRLSLPPLSSLVGHWPLLGPVAIPVEVASSIPGTVRKTFWSCGGAQNGRMLIGTRDRRLSLEEASSSVNATRGLGPIQPHMIAFETYLRGGNGAGVSSAVEGSWVQAQGLDDLADLCLLTQGESSPLSFSNDSPLVSRYLTLSSAGKDTALSFLTFGQVSFKEQRGNTAQDENARTALFKLNPSPKRPTSTISILRSILKPLNNGSFDLSQSPTSRSHLKLRMSAPTRNCPSPVVAVLLSCTSSYQEPVRLAGIQQSPPPFEFPSAIDANDLISKHPHLAVKHALTSIDELGNNILPYTISPSSSLLISFSASLVPSNASEQTNVSETKDTVEISMTVWATMELNGMIEDDFRRSILMKNSEVNSSGLQWSNCRPIVRCTSRMTVDSQVNDIPSIELDLAIVLSSMQFASPCALKSSYENKKNSITLGVVSNFKGSTSETSFRSLEIPVRSPVDNMDDVETVHPRWLDKAGNVEILGSPAWSLSVMAISPQIQGRYANEVNGAIENACESGSYYCEVIEFNFRRDPSGETGHSAATSSQTVDICDEHPYSTFGFSVLRAIACNFLLHVKPDVASQSTLKDLRLVTARASTAKELAATFSLWKKHLLFPKEKRDRGTNDDDLERSDNGKNLNIPQPPQEEDATIAYLASWLYDVISLAPPTSLKPLYSASESKTCPSQNRIAWSALESIPGLSTCIPAAYCSQTRSHIETELQKLVMETLGIEEKKVSNESKIVPAAKVLDEAYVKTCVSELFDFSQRSLYCDDKTDATDPVSPIFVHRKVTCEDRTIGRFKAILRSASHTLLQNYKLLRCHIATEAAYQDSISEARKLLPKFSESNSIITWCTQMGPLTLRRPASQLPLGYMPASAFKSPAGFVATGFLALTPLHGYSFLGATWTPSLPTTGTALPAGADSFPHGTLLTDATCVARNLTAGSTSAGMSDVASPLQLQFANLCRDERRKEADSFSGERLAMIEMTNDTGRGDILTQDNGQFSRGAWTGLRIPSQSAYFKQVLHGVGGLLNLGNTCYQNSVFQSLFSTQMLRQSLLIKAPMRPPFPFLHPADVVDANTLSLLLGDNATHISPVELSGIVSSKERKVADWLQHLFVCLSQSRRQGTAATRLQDLFGEPYNQRQSQDAYLFGTMLLDSLSAGLHNTSLSHILSNTFGLRMTTQRECLECKAVRSTHEASQCLALNFPTTYSPITDILPLSGYTTELCPPDGYERLLGNLNEGRNKENSNDDDVIVPHVYMCISRVGEGLPITDICVVYGTDTLEPEAPPGFTLIKENLNSGSAFNPNGYSSYLAVRRHPFASPITELQIIVSNSNSKPSPQAGYTLVPGDLNRPSLKAVRALWDKDSKANAEKADKAMREYYELVAEAESVYAVDPAMGSQLFAQLPDAPSGTVEPPKTVPSCPKQVHIAIRRGGLLRDVTLVEADNLEDGLQRCPEGFTLVPRNLNPRCSPLNDLIMSTSNDSEGSAVTNDASMSGTFDDEEVELLEAQESTSQMTQLPPIRRLIGYRHIYLAYTCGGDKIPITGLRFETVDDKRAFEVQAKLSEMDDIEQRVGRVNQVLTLSPGEDDLKSDHDDNVLLISCIAGAFMELRVTRGEGPPIRAEALEVAKAPESLSRAAQAFGSCATSPGLPYADLDSSIGLVLPFSSKSSRITKNYVALRESNRRLWNGESENTPTTNSEPVHNPLPQPSLTRLDGSSTLGSRPPEPITILLQKWLWTLQSQSTPSLGPLIMWPEAVGPTTKLEKIERVAPPEVYATNNASAVLEHYLPPESVAYWIDGTWGDNPLSGILYYSPLGTSLSDIHPSKLDLAVAHALNDDESDSARGGWVLEGIRRDKKENKQGTPFTLSVSEDTLQGHLSAVRGNKTTVIAFPIDRSQDPTQQPNSVAGLGGCFRPPAIGGVWQTDAQDIIILEVTTPSPQPAAWVCFKGWWVDSLVGGQGNRNARNSKQKNSKGRGKKQAKASNTEASQKGFTDLEEDQMQFVIDSIDLELESYLLGANSSKRIGATVLSSVLPSSLANRDTESAGLSSSSSASSLPSASASQGNSSGVVVTEFMENMVRDGNGWLHCIIAQDNSPSSWRIMGRFGAPHIKSTGFFDSVLKSPFREFGGGSSTTLKPTTTIVPSARADNKTETKAERGSSVIGGRIDQSLIGFQLNSSAFYSNGVRVFPEPPSRTDVKALIATLTKQEILMGSNAVTCSNCNQRSATIQKIEIPEAPQHLMLNIMRFDMDWRTGETRKTMTYCDFEQELELSLAGDQKKVRYALHAIVVHSGVGISNGHYFAFTRDSSRAAEDPLRAPWRLTDDLKISSVEFEEIKMRIKSSTKETAQMLIYVRIEYSKNETAGLGCGYSPLLASPSILNYKYVTASTKQDADTLDKGHSSLWSASAEIAALSALRESAGALPLAPGSRRDFNIETLTAVDPTLLPFNPANTDGTFASKHKGTFIEHFRKMSEALPAASLQSTIAHQAWARMTLGLFSPSSLIKPVEMDQFMEMNDLPFVDSVQAAIGNVPTCTACGISSSGCDEALCGNQLWRRD